MRHLFAGFSPTSPHPDTADSFRHGACRVIRVLDRWTVYFVRPDRTLEWVGARDTREDAIRLADSDPRAAA